jgi:hypothetical protein
MRQKKSKLFSSLPTPAYRLKEETAERAHRNRPEHHARGRNQSGVWSLESGVWSLESGVWSLESGVWSPESGVRSLESRSDGMNLDVGFNPRRTARHLTSDI